ncbi:protein Flattop isoform X2 [Hippocampus zosterae]|uniref:protein Flattop isoform X2 n=1 Tax=Hippocampus zosterae TaxID=109293 RepID=UPI00223CED87|nr:protein Flattop isoform X2 [Hippocampus zosterae]
MSSNYSANQASKARRGHTMFIADNRGHLLPGMAKRGSAWPDFKGTWDLPARIPVQRVNPTSRSVEGLERLKAWGLDPQPRGKSMPRRGSKNTNAAQEPSKQTRGVEQDGAVSTSVAPSAAEAQQASQSRPISAHQRTGNQGQDTETDEVSSVTLPARDSHNASKTVTSWPLSQRAMSALLPTTRQGHQARPNTGPMSAPL